MAVGAGDSLPLVREGQVRSAGMKAVYGGDVSWWEPTTSSIVIELAIGCMVHFFDNTRDVPKVNRSIPLQFILRAVAGRDQQRTTVEQAMQLLPLPVYCNMVSY